MGDESEEKGPDGVSAHCPAKHRDGDPQGHPQRAREGARARPSLGIVPSGDLVNGALDRAEPGEREQHGHGEPDGRNHPEIAQENEAQLRLVHREPLERTGDAEPPADEDGEEGLDEDDLAPDPQELVGGRRRHGAAARRRPFRAPRGRGVWGRVGIVHDRLFVERRGPRTVSYRNEY